jgi:uncharacterized membrane protein
VKVRADRGFVLISAMLIMLMLAGFLGLMADTANLQLARQRTQTAADAAAIAAWHELQRGNTAGMLRAAEGDAARNGVRPGDSTHLEIHCPPVTGDFAANPSAVEASIVAQAPTMFMRIFGQNAITIHSRAVAIGGRSGSATLGE